MEISIGDIPECSPAGARFRAFVDPFDCWPSVSPYSFRCLLGMYLGLLAKNRRWHWF